MALDGSSELLKKAKAWMEKAEKAREEFSNDGLDEEDCLLRCFAYAALSAAENFDAVAKNPPKVKWGGWSE